MKASQPPIQIPEPCQAGWDSMSPVSEGRFCLLCNKTVVDFSTMSTEEIMCYFADSEGKSICGHFYKDQLSEDHSNYQKRLLARYRKAKHSVKNKFVRLSMLALFGIMLSVSGCNSHREEEQVDGKISRVPTDTLHNEIDSNKTH
jgi:hypothetical protein